MMPFSTPPAPAGSTDQQLRQLYTHLYRLTEQLNALAMELEQRLQQNSNEHKGGSYGR